MRNRNNLTTKVKERHAHINRKLREKIRESVRSTLPITAIVFLLSVTVTPIPIGSLTLFLFGSVMLVLGLGIFTLGTEMSMIPMGEGMGVYISRGKKIGAAALLCFALGVIVTVAEPDLQVLANQVPSIDNFMLIVTVAAGVGVFLSAALLRVYFRIPLSLMLIGFYALAFALAFFAPTRFIPLAFDSGGVTTGPVTVPFIMSFGIGLAALRGDKNSREDSFGLVALCSIGPILAVMLLSILYNPSAAAGGYFSVPDVVTSQDAAQYFLRGLPAYVSEVALSILPIVLMFAVFQLLARRFHKKQIAKMIIGLFYSYAGLVLFLTGVNVGFMPVGHAIGGLLAHSGAGWLLVPLGMLVGYFIVEAEPAVHVLKTQVEELSNGAIPQKTLQKSLSLGVGCAVGISMIRVLTGVSIFYFLIPGYAAALALSFFVPKFFTAVAFDSGGVASGPMTATFLLPFAIGATEALGGDILLDTFGVVAMVAMTPLIAIQILGLVSERRRKQAAAARKKDPRRALALRMIYYDEEVGGIG